MCDVHAEVSGDGEDLPSLPVTNLHPSPPVHLAGEAGRK